MLANYFQDQFGIIHQKNKQPFFKIYAHEYNSYGEKSNYISYLRLGYIFGILPKIAECQSILDVGFGNGSFLRACQKWFTKCAGNDLFYDFLPESCIKQESITQNYYDIITFFDSLEHLEDINCVRDLKCRYVVISVPNCKYGENDQWFENWKHRRPDEHLHHFNSKSLTAFMTDSGYNILDISYYEDSIRKSNESQNVLTVACEKI